MHWERMDDDAGEWEVIESDPIIDSLEALHIGKGTSKVDDFSKPGCNEMFFRFQSFVQDGVRTVIPRYSPPSEFGPSIPEELLKRPTPDDIKSFKAEKDSSCPSSTSKPLLDISKGSRVRIHGLTLRPDLNGQEGIVHGFEEQSGRWTVNLGNGTCKIRAINIETLVSKKEPASTPGSVSLILASFETAAELLEFCAERKDSLNISDICDALQRMLKSSDYGIMRADQRLADILAHVRESLSIKATSKDLVSLMQVLKNLDLHSQPLLQAVAEQIMLHISEYSMQDLVLTILAFAHLCHADVVIFNCFSNELKRHATKLVASDIVCLFNAFARVGLRNFETLDDLFGVLEAQLSGLSNEELVQFTKSCMFLDILDGQLLVAVAGESRTRIEQLSLCQVITIASSMATSNYDFAESTVDFLLTYACDSAGNLKQKSLSLKDAFSLLDALTNSCHNNLISDVKTLLFPTVCEVARLLFSECGASGTFAAGVVELRAIFLSIGSNLGVVGTRWALEQAGFRCTDAEFVKRAVNRISWEAGRDDDWETQTSRVCSFAMAEWRQFASECPTTPTDEGYFVHSSSCQISSKLWAELLENLLVSNGEQCVVSQSICKLDDIFASSSITHSRLEVSLFVSKAPDFPGLLSLARFCSRWKRMTLAISVGTRPYTFRASELIESPAASCIEEEVIECSLDGCLQAEAEMEIVD